MVQRKLISFDWAMKRLLRSKANFEVLEGFLSELLKDDIEILEILESEGNKATHDDKLNQVDLKVKNRNGEIILVEVQHDRELDYLHRILYASSKTITEHLKEGDAYQEVVKVVSVSILYFDLGQGQDYVYHGKTDFIGIHQHDHLQLNSRQQRMFNKQQAYAIFPEYYLLKVNQFDGIARDSLDEWMYFLKNGEIKEDFVAKGLKKAQEVMAVLKLSDAERAQYERYVDYMHYEASMSWSLYQDGRFDGIAEGIEQGLEQGLEQGRQEAMLNLAKNMKQAGESLEKIASYTGLSLAQLQQL
jgi:predicted transposase/invertase (TIGR01784 family)